MRTKKNYKKLIVISEPVFNSAVNIFINYTFEELNAFLKSKKQEPIEDEYSYCKGFCARNRGADGAFYYIVQLPDFKYNLSSQAVLAHELSHFVYMQMDEKGITEVKMNEAFSYMLEYYLLNSSREISKLFAKK